MAELMANKKSTGISKEAVKYVAHLARINLRAGESGVLAKQLEDILSFIDKLKEVDISKVKPTSHILPIENVLREDKLKASLPIEESLNNAPQREGNFFGVPKVIE
jgi:aspartyl-tRNA(Asn)/glutamyl-tRNA(Gln) amidotransferase subunit C